MKHNKKRNTAFLYEILIKEYTKSIIRKDEQRKKVCLSIIKEFFSGTILKKEKDIIFSIVEARNVPKDLGVRLIVEAKRSYISLDKKDIFNSQTNLIKKINESLSRNVFSNFVADFKNIATAWQYLNASSSQNPMDKVLLEEKIINTITSSKESKEQMRHVDNLTYKMFTKRFNDTYKNSLRENQKHLLTNYITSFSDNGLGLKSFLNEEIGRLKKEIKENDAGVYQENMLKVYEKLESFSKHPVSEDMVREVFYIQDLIYEVLKK
jgi:hypothetical protein